MIDLEAFETVIFHHIPKTAGMTMLAVLDQVEEPECIHTVAPRNDPSHEAALREFYGLTDEEKRGIRVLRGHDVYGFDRHLPHTCAYFTILRDPARRLVSSYHHLMRAPAHLPEREEILAAQPSLAEYLEGGDVYLGHDSQLKTFIGYDPETEPDVTDEELLERATTALHDEYALVGMTERFDETLVLAARTFGWTIEGYERRNVSTRYDRSALDPGILRRYAELNPLDVEFHARASDLFDARVDRYDGDFARELEDLRRKNVRFRRKNAVLRSFDRIRGFFPGSR